MQGMHYMQLKSIKYKIYIFVQRLVLIHLKHNVFITFAFQKTQCFDVFSHLAHFYTLLQPVIFLHSWGYCCIFIQNKTLLPLVMQICCNVVCFFYKRHHEKCFYKLLYYLLFFVNSNLNTSIYIYIIKFLLYIINSNYISNRHLYIIYSYTLYIYHKSLYKSLTSQRSTTTCIKTPDVMTGSPNAINWLGWGALMTPSQTVWTPYSLPTTAIDPLKTSLHTTLTDLDNKNCYARLLFVGYSSVFNIHCI